MKVDKLSITDYGNLTAAHLGFRTIVGVHYDSATTSITLNLSDGETLPLGAVKPPAARNIVGVRLDEDNHLIFEMDVGQDLDAGIIEGGVWRLPTFTGNQGILRTVSGNIFKSLVSDSDALTITELTDSLQIDLTLPDSTETFGTRIAVLTEEVAGSVGTTVSAVTATVTNAYYVRPFTHARINNIGLTLDAGKVILPAGTYRVYCSIPGIRVMAGLRNAATGEVLLSSVNGDLLSATGGLASLSISGYLDLKTTTTIELYQYLRSQLNAGTATVVDAASLTATFVKMLVHKVSDYTAPAEAYVHPLEPHLYSGYWYSDMRFQGAAGTLGGSWIPGTDKFNGGVLGPNGKIYCAPDAGGKVLIIDVAGNTSTASNFGLTLSGTYGGGCLAGDGKIYFAPKSATGILVVDPVANTAVELAYGLTLSGSSKYYGAVMGGNGKIYCIPHNATSVLVIDPSTQTATLTNFGIGMSGTNKWSTGCLGLDGKIYCVPVDSGSVLVINPSTDSATTVPAGTIGKFESSCLGSDGKIYAAGANVNQLMVIDTKLNTVTVKVIPGTFTGSKYYVGGCLGADGLIYFCPHDQQGVLRYDPFKETFEHVTYGITMTGTEKWSGAVLAVTGVMYFIPNNDTNGILTVSSLLKCAAFENRLLLSPFLNKF